MAAAEAEAKLFSHCQLRKYGEKADAWYGVALKPDGQINVVAAQLSGPCVFDVELQLALDSRPDAAKLVQPQGGPE